MPKEQFCTRTCSISTHQAQTKYMGCLLYSRKCHGEFPCGNGDDNNAYSTLIRVKLCFLKFQLAKTFCGNAVWFCANGVGIKPAGMVTRLSPVSPSTVQLTIK